MRLALVTLAALVLASVASAATSPRDIYRTAMVAAALEKSVHYVAASSLAGNHETIVGDAGLGRGIQRITFTKGGTTGHLTVLVIGETAYVRADHFTLVSFLGLTGEQAARLTNHWFFIKGPSGAYAAVAEAVDFRSFVRELEMPDPITLGPATSFAGKHVTAVRSIETRAGKTATIDMFIGDDTPLPLGQVAKGTQGSITTTLSRWNEAVFPTAPKSAVAFR